MCLSSYLTIFFQINKTSECKRKPISSILNLLLNFVKFIRLLNLSILETWCFWRTLYFYYYIIYILFHYDNASSCNDLNELWTNRSTPLSSFLIFLDPFLSLFFVPPFLRCSFTRQIFQRWEEGSVVFHPSGPPVLNRSIKIINETK